MVQLITGQNIEYTADCAAFRIVRAEHQPGDARMNDSTCAHGTGFQRYIQCGATQAVILQLRSARPQRHDFSMGGGIMAGDRPVPAFGNHLIVFYQHCTHWHFTFIRSALRQGQCVLHPF